MIICIKHHINQLTKRDYRRSLYNDVSVILPKYLPKKVCQCDKNYLYKDMEVSYVADTETISITTGTHDVT